MVGIGFGRVLMLIETKKLLVLVALRSGVAGEKEGVLMHIVSFSISYFLFWAKGCEVSAAFLPAAGQERHGKGCLPKEKDGAL